MSIEPARLCARCVLPHRPPDIILDGEGVCSVCRAEETSAETAPLLETDFVRLLQKHRGKGRHDCLVMCSGGKDSTAALYYMKRRYKMNPLAFMFDHGFETQDAIDNVRRAVDKLGVDLLFWQTDELKDLFRRLIQGGSRAVVCHPCSIWYMRLTFDIAARFDIPLIIAGWTKGQSARPGVMSKCACNVDAPEYASMAVASQEFLRSLKQDPGWRDFPSSMEEVVARASKKHHATVLSPHWFLEANADEYVEVIQRELGWRYPSSSYPGRSTNCEMNFVSAWRSLENFGYTHYHVEMSKLVRRGFMTRAEALELLEPSFGEEKVREVLARLGLPLASSS